MKRAFLLWMPATCMTAAALWGFSAGKHGIEAKPFDKLPPERRKTEFVTKEVRGQLMTVQLDLVVVRSNGAVMTTLELTRDTRVRIGSRDGTVADLKVGMDVTAFYIEERYRKVATTIVVDRPVVVDRR